MEVSEEQLLTLKELINSLDGFKFDDIKRLYKNSDITTIDKLKEYILNRSKEQKKYLQILLVLNSKQEPHGHYVVIDEYGSIFDPLGRAGLINMENITNDVKEYIIFHSNSDIIQNIDSECCGLLCLLFIYLNIILNNKKRSFVNIRIFRKIIDNLRSDYPDKNIFNLIYELIKTIDGSKEQSSFTHKMV